MMSSVGIDYDGDGNTSEGIYDELVGLRDKLLARRSASTARSTARRSATPSTAYPVLVRRRRRRRQPARPAEAVAANAFKSWTARLVRATYNFQLARKDPGAFAHNAKYVIELLLRLDHRRRTAGWWPRST